MASCWHAESDERPSFDELAAELENVLSSMVGYVKLNMKLVDVVDEKHSISN